MITNLMSSIGVSSSSEELTLNSQNFIICERMTENRSKSEVEHFGFAAMDCNARRKRE